MERQNSPDEEIPVYLPGSDLKRLISFLTGVSASEAKPSFLSSLSILDVASGVIDSGFYADYHYYPDLGKICVDLGIDVTMLDLHFPLGLTEISPRERTIGFDLQLINSGTVLAQLPGLQGREFDIISCFNFIGDNPDWNLRNSFTGDGDDFKAFERKLISQCGCLLKEGGIMFFDEILTLPSGRIEYIYYTKRNGRIIKKQSKNKKN